MPFISFFLYAIVNSFTPGPNNFMAMSFGNKYGFRRAFIFSIGVSIGFFIIVLLSSLFNVMLLQVLPFIELPLKVFGLAYMLYLAYVIVFVKKVETKANAPVHLSKYIIWIGIFMQFVNPKAILYGITIVNLFILPYYHAFKDFFIFSLLLGFIGLLSATTWSLFGSVLKRTLTKYEKIFNIIMALLLVYSAFTIVLH